MLKMVLGALAALTALVAAPAMAQVTPPAHVKMVTVTVGKLEGDKAPVTIGGKTLVVKLSGCDASWTTGDAFYAIATADSNPYVMHKGLMDYAWEKSGKDWNTAFNAMVQAKQVCLVSPAE